MLRIKEGFGRRVQLGAMAMTMALLVAGVVCLVNAPSANAADACSSTGYVCVHYTVLKAHYLNSASACVKVFFGTRQRGTMYVWVYDRYNNPVKEQVSEKMYIDHYSNLAPHECVSTMTWKQPNYVDMFSNKIGSPEICANWQTSSGRWYKQVCRSY
jgi:hypothetical protein